MVLGRLRVLFLSLFAVLPGNQALHAAAFLTFSPGRVSLSGYAGQTTVTQTVTMLNTGNTATDWSVTTNAPWLTASPATGFSLAAGGSVTITLIADPSHLNPNTYQANVTPSGSSAPLPVTFTVSGTSITVIPNPIVLSVLAGTSPTLLNVGQINGNAGISISVTSGSSWLSATLTGQIAPIPFSLTINAKNLTPSSSAYQGSLLVQCTSAPCISQTVPVQLTVYTPITLSCTQSTGPTQAGVAYSNTCTASGGNNSYVWSISQGALPPGLSFSSSTGRAIQIAGTPTTTGPYSYTVAVSDTSMNQLSASQSFNGTIGTAAAPTFSVSPGTLPFGSYTVGGPLPAGQSIAVSSTNPSSGLGFTTTTSSDCAWLALAPASGFTPATLAASVTGNPAPGSHSCIVTFNVNGISPSPTVTATLNVVAPVPTLTASPATLSFSSYTAGGTVPPGQSITLTSTVPTSGVAFNSILGSDCGWLVLSPASGSTPQTVSAFVNAATATPGNHSCAITFTANGISPSPIVTATLSVSAGPLISAIVKAAGFVPGQPLAPGSWASVFGTGLSPAGDSRPWNTSTEIVNGMFPTALDGTSVTVNGNNASVEYISPGQVNIQLPDDTATGPVQVVLSSATGPSASFMITYAPFAPGLFTATSLYLAAQHADGSYIGGYPGATPAKPGETITLWGTGFGPANPPVAAGQLFTGANQLANDVTVTIGGQYVPVDYAGIVGAGLVQLNVEIPLGMLNGDAPVVATVGGVSSQSSGNLITIHN